MFTIEKAIQQHATSFKTDCDLDKIIHEIGDAKIVLLGEASHGSSEFYTVRAQLTKKLIEEKDFNIIAVEGDWPACQQVNQHLKNFGETHQKTSNVLKAFNRWPTWMWANEEIVDLVDMLKSVNTQLDKNKKVGFYGIDIYSLWESMEDLFNELAIINDASKAFEQIKKVINCFQPFKGQADQYAILTAYSATTCSEQVSVLLKSIRKNIEQYSTNEEQKLNLLMNALILNNAEAYYRTSMEQNALSWNIRDTHMVETINELRNYHGADAKVIVWAHNTHIGDASATTMKNDGTINVGQLLREQHKDNVYAIGFGTNHGTVIAADEWGDSFETMEVPPAKTGSWEDLLRQSGPFNKILIFNDENREYFTKWIDHRAIGVTYTPAYERYNYVPTQIGKRYDAFIYLDKTNALKPL